MKLSRTFGLWSSVSIVLGGIIGSGIFMKPALMASQLGSPLLLIGVWVFAGVLTLFGALTNAEIAALRSTSVSTVQNQVHSILDKLGLPNRAAAAAYAVRNGLLAETG